MSNESMLIPTLLVSLAFGLLVCTMTPLPLLWQKSAAGGLAFALLGGVLYFTGPVHR
jgi:hypothetical protein